MSYKNILVYVGSQGNTKATLEAACLIASENGAHVTGLHISTPLSAPLYSTPRMPAKLVEIVEAENHRVAEEARGEFEKAVHAHGCSAEWKTLTGYLDEEVNKLARYADLVVIGQNGDVDNHNVSHGIENNILMGAARPVLIVPYIGFNKTLGKKVMVAWNDSKEATRAVNDAMPLLKSANLVNVVSLSDKPADDDVPTADICLYLARHDVNAEATKSYRDGLTTTDALLNLASDKGIDLIVMGAYGHSRLREMVLGGATYNILQHMTVPVLMSH